jgi:chemotaxis protein MotB
MDSSISRSVLNHSFGSGDNDYLFGGRMPETLHWSIPWSDLMMTLFILFAVMYVYQVSIKEIRPPNNISAHVVPLVNIDETIPEPEEDSIQDIYDLSRETLNIDKLRSISSVELIPDKAVRIILTGDLLFDLGKANLREEAKMSLREISAILRQTPYMVNVVGHTDDLPINTEQFPSNWELSTTRACQVARFLIEEMNIQAEKFFISGHASYQPIKHNDGAVERAANRRVEIIITKERPYAVQQVME